MVDTADVVVEKNTADATDVVVADESISVVVVEHANGIL